MLLRWQDFGTAERINKIADTVISSEEPTFVFSNLVETHFPYKPVRYADHFLPDDVTRRELQWAVDVSFLNATMSEEGLDSRQEEILAALYDAEIRYTDEQIGRLYDRLSESGKLEETVLIVTADHGDTIGGSGVYGHRGEMDPEITEIPMIAHYPGVDAEVVEGYVEFKDLYGHLRSIADGIVEPLSGKEYAITEYYGLDTQHVGLFEDRDVNEAFWGRYQVAVHRDGQQFHYDSYQQTSETRPLIRETIGRPQDEYLRYRGSESVEVSRISNEAENRLKELGYK